MKKNPISLYSLVYGHVGKKYSMILISLCYPRDWESIRGKYIFNRVIVRTSRAYSGESKMWLFVVIIFDQPMSDRIINTLLDIEQILFCCKKRNVFGDKNIYKTMLNSFNIFSCNPNINIMFWNI